MKQKPVRIKSADAVYKQVDSEQHIVTTDKQLTINNEVLEANNSNSEPLQSIDGQETPRLGKLVKLAFVSISALASVQLTEALISIFETNTALGVIFSSILLAILYQAAKYTYRFFKHKNKLITQEKLKAEIMTYDSETSHGAALPTLQKLHSNRLGWSALEFDKFKSKAAICQDDSEVIHLYSSAILKGMDAKAKSILVKHSTDSALMVALSPFAAVDMMLVLWRNFKMIEELSQVYGLSDIPLSRFKIMKQVLNNMMYVGASELLLDASFDSLGLSLSSKLSARAAQGVGAGLITLRVGMKTIEYCRPLLFNEQHRISVADMRAEVITQVKDRLIALGKESKS